MGRLEPDFEEEYAKELNARYGFTGGAVAGPEEFAHLEQCIRNPEGPSSKILKGAELLRRLRRLFLKP